MKEEDASDRSAGAPPAVTGATRPRFSETTIRDRGRLPHWEHENATYFITFRLADSLPQSVLDRIASERKGVLDLARQQSRLLTSSEKLHLKRIDTVRMLQYLDSGYGACPLRTPALAAKVAETLIFFDEKRYRLHAWCIMPNHVHVVAQVFPAYQLPEILHSWKSFTAKAANRILGTTGSFWQKEYYDHLIRDEAQFHRALNYVIANPEKASLQNWTWVWMRGQDARVTAGEDASATLKAAGLES
ncbi:MAG: transposase [Terriglobales bacterium]